MPGKPLNILILEDLRTDAELVKRQVLKIRPESIFTIARNKTEFYEKIEWVLPDIILADYNLPDMNGLEALFYIRENKPYIPFIFITGILNDEEKVADAVLKGASGYVLKENLDHLPTKLEDVLKRAAAEKAAAMEGEKRWREAELSLQKSLSLLSKTDDFNGKAEIQKLLNGIMNTIQELD